jgi:phosphoserine phosphatase
VIDNSAGHERPAAYYEGLSDYVIVLVAAPGSDALDEKAAATIAEATVSQSVEAEQFGHFTVLAPKTAAEVTFQAAHPDEATDVVDEIAHAFHGLPIDIALLSNGDRRMRLLVADMDSTIIGQECIDELADLVGRKAEIAAITEQAMRGEIDFEAALTERVRQLAGIDLGQIDRLLTERITLNAGARTLVATMRQHGARTALVSGGFTPFTKAIAARAGFDQHFANELVIDQGRLTGQVTTPILGALAKRGIMQNLALELRTKMSEVIAVGDGANDLPMLMAAGVGVAYHAKPAVAERAKVALRHADLTGLLYLQGYRQSQFVATDDK